MVWPSEKCLSYKNPNVPHCYFTRSLPVLCTMKPQEVIADTNIYIYVTVNFLEFLFVNMALVK